VDLELHRLATQSPRGDGDHAAGSTRSGVPVSRGARGIETWMIATHTSRSSRFRNSVLVDTAEQTPELREYVDHGTHAR
jgi:hypothetical protein